MFTDMTAGETERLLCSGVFYFYPISVCHVNRREGACPRIERELIYLGNL